MHNGMALVFRQLFYRTPKSGIPGPFHVTQERQLWGSLGYKGCLRPIVISMAQVSLQGIRISMVINKFYKAHVASRETGEQY